MKALHSLLATGMLLVASFALADTLPKTKTFEVSINAVRIPASVGGTMSFRECSDCEYQTLRVTPRTQFVINNSAMRLPKFRLRVEELRLHGERTVNVTVDQATNTVATVFLSDQ